MPIRSSTIFKVSVALGREEATLSIFFNKIGSAGKFFGEPSPMPKLPVIPALHEAIEGKVARRWQLLAAMDAAVHA